MVADCPQPNRWSAAKLSILPFNCRDRPDLIRRVDARISRFGCSRCRQNNSTGVGSSATRKVVPTTLHSPCRYSRARLHASMRSIKSPVTVTLRYCGATWYWTLLLARFFRCEDTFNDGPAAAAERRATFADHDANGAAARLPATLVAETLAEHDDRDAPASALHRRGIRVRIPDRSVA